MTNLNKNVTQKEKSEIQQGTIVHIAPTPFFSNRGCHIRILNEIEGLRQKGVRVIVCTYGLGKNLPEIDIRRICQIPGYTKTEAGFSPYKFIADFLLFFLALKTVWQERVCIIHGHLHEGGLIGWGIKVILFWRKISVIMDIQGSLSGELQAYGTFNKFPSLLKIFYFFERVISLMPDRIICSSPSSRQFITGTCCVDSSRVDLLEDVVPDSFFSEHDKSAQKTNLDLPFDKKIVVYSGSLLPGKGVDILLKAIRIIISSRRDILFILIGYPKDWVETFSEQHNLEDNVIIPGEIPYKKLADWLSTADLAIDPKVAGSGEASGKILHYMASGLCVACFSSENNQKFLGNHCFFAASESALDLAESIELALIDDDIRNKYGSSGREKARTDFSLIAAGSRLKKIYKKITC